MEEDCVRRQSMISVVVRRLEAESSPPTKKQSAQILSKPRPKKVDQGTSTLCPGPSSTRNYRPETLRVTADKTQPNARNCTSCRKRLSLSTERVHGNPHTHNHLETPTSINLAIYSLTRSEPTRNTQLERYGALLRRQRVLLLRGDPLHSIVRLPRPAQQSKFRCALVVPKYHVTKPMLSTERGSVPMGGDTEQYNFVGMNAKPAGRPKRIALGKTAQDLSSQLAGTGTLMSSRSPQPPVSVRGKYEARRAALRSIAARRVIA